MTTDEWLAMQAELRMQAADLAPAFITQHEGPDLLSLAREMQLLNPRLSFDQAMDAAMIEQREIGDYVAEWENERVIQWAELMNYAHDWDARAAFHYGLDLGKNDDL